MDFSLKQCECLLARRWSSLLKGGQLKKMCVFVCHQWIIAHLYVYTWYTPTPFVFLHLVWTPPIVNTSSVILKTDLIGRDRKWMNFASVFTWRIYGHTLPWILIEIASYIIVRNPSWTLGKLDMLLKKSRKKGSKQNTKLSFFWLN